MTSIGYPDFHAPRDYLSGVASGQLIVSNGLSGGSGSFTFYTVPAGQHLLIRSILVNTYVGANGVGPISSYQIELSANKGFDGASAAQRLAYVIAATQINSHDNQNVLIPGPIQIDGGAAGNPLIYTATAVQAAQAQSQINLYGIIVS